MSRIAFIILLLQLACATGFAQTSYKGLTPGQSTRADVERVLGRPLKDVSKTLVEYKSAEAEGKLFVQYRDDSPAAIVERIERTCYTQSCASVRDEFFQQTDAVLADASSKNEKQGRGVIARYYGAPRFIVHTLRGDTPTDFEKRVGFYSKELYESAVPKGGCTGTIFGTWQTERGRMTIVREGDNGIRGTYAKNNGAFSLKQQDDAYPGGYIGKWRDDTGSGTMALLFESYRNSFSASLAHGGETSVPPNKRTENIGAIKLDEPELEKLDKVRVLVRDGLPPGEPLIGKCVP
jgi:hypothetical protein